MCSEDSGLKLRRGFTLLELMVSVAIIAVLISVLLPALLKARQVSHRTVCMGNLKQLGYAFQQYLLDHRRFPQASESMDWRYGGVEFRDSGGGLVLATLTASRPLNSVLSDTLPTVSGELAGLYRCPADSGLWRGRASRAGSVSVLEGKSCYTMFGNSYRANLNLLDSTSAGIDDRRRPLFEHEVVVAPSRLLVTGDSAWYYGTRSSDDPDAGIDASWHGDDRSGNFLSMDGSVRYSSFGGETSPLYTLSPRLR